MPTRNKNPAGTRKTRNWGISFILSVENFAKKSDLKVLEKYINLLNFMKFVTEDDVKKLIEKRGDKNRSAG